MPVDISKVLAADLTELVQGLDGHGANVDSSLSMLHRDLRLAVRSLLAFSISVVDRFGSRVAFSCSAGPVHPDQVSSSLKVPLRGAALPASEMTMTLYAARPGAFVDLGADLAYALDVPLDTARIDQDLPTSVITAGVSGLEDHTTVQRAVGVLLARGLGVEEIATTLHRDGLPNHVRVATEIAERSLAARLN